MECGENNPFEKIRDNMRKMILSDYPSVENFCLVHDLNKSTIYRFMRGEVAEVKTLDEMAKALGKTLKLDIE